MEVENDAVSSEDLEKVIDQSIIRVCKSHDVVKYKN